MIEVKLVTFYKAVAMQVLRQEGIERGCGEVFNNSWFVLRSSVEPALNSKSVYIGGTAIARDEEIIIRNFSNNKQRDQYFSDVVQLFKDYQNRGKKEQSIDNDSIIIRVE